MQAKMWKTDKQNWEEEEKRLKSRIDSINKENQQYLLDQISAKNQKDKNMHPSDFAINKPLLREINQKLKSQSEYAQEGISVRSELQ